MDKPRDVKRGASRFSTAKLRIKQSRRRLFGGLDGTGEDFEFPEKSKKGKVRSLSAVGRALSRSEDYKMGCDVAEKVEQSPSSDIIASSKRYKNKTPQKFFYDCNGVDHASVPRKLRSAMKKRYREYDFPDSEKVNHKLNGIESPERDGTKKTRVNSKQGSPNWSPIQIVPGPITKDEEEVVETLYALAGMFPNSDSNDRSKLDSDSLPENSVLEDLEKSTNAAFEAPGISPDASPSCDERSPGEAAKNNSLDESTGQKQTDLLENAGSLMAADSVAFKLNLQNMPNLVRSGNGNEVAFNDSGLSLAMGLNMPRQSPSLDIEMKPEMARAVECKQEHHMIKDQNKNDDPTSWPGLSLAVPARSHDSKLQSYAAKAPLRLDSATCASKQDLTQRGSTNGKISGVVIRKKSWKSCAAHVHICNLIRSFQVPNSKDTLLLQQPNQSNQFRTNEGSTHGVLMEVQNLNRVRCEITSVPETGHSDTAKDSHETKNSTLQQPHRFHDISPEAPALDVFGPQKQCFESLRLSSGVNGSKVNYKFDKGGGSMLEPLSKLQVPYFQPPAQQHMLMSFPGPQTQYASTSYPDQISVAAQQVLPHYYGNPLWGTRNSTTASIKQQQQNFWLVQVAAQGQRRSGVNCNIIRAHHPNWEGGTQDNCVVSRGPSIVPHSPPSLQIVGSKFSPISEQQHQLIALASSLPHSRSNGLDFHLPSSLCDQNRGSRFRSSSGTPPLQLLCDERL